jgi:hypothetical protein
MVNVAPICNTTIPSRHGSKWQYRILRALDTTTRDTGYRPNHGALEGTVHQHLGINATVARMLLPLSLKFAGMVSFPYADVLKHPSI